MPARAFPPDCALAVPASLGAMAGAGAGAAPLAADDNAALDRLLADLGEQREGARGFVYLLGDLQRALERQGRCPRRRSP